jgi:hypothetical protein
MPGDTTGNVRDDIMFEQFYDQTYMFGPNPDELLDSHSRDTLCDLSPDAPFLASDEPRNGRDPITGDRRMGGRFSESRICLQTTGARRDVDVYMPEGTFIDYDFLGADPRGTFENPNMRDMVKHTQSRKKEFKLYNDAEYTMPSGGINPKAINYMKRDVRVLTKGYMPWFSTSLDNYVYSDPKFGPRNNNLTTMDGEVVDISKNSLLDRTTATAKYSNEARIGWQSTPDHEFEVAKYGNPYGAPVFATDAFRRARDSVETSQRSARVADGMFMPSQLILDIGNLIRAKDTSFRMSGVRLDGESKEARVRRQAAFSKNGDGYGYDQFNKMDTEDVKLRISQIAHEMAATNISHMSRKGAEMINKQHFDNDFTQFVAECLDEQVRANGKNPAKTSGISTINMIEKFVVGETLQMQSRAGPTGKKFDGGEATVHFTNYKTDIGVNLDDHDVQSYANAAPFRPFDPFVADMGIASIHRIGNDKEAASYKRTVKRENTLVDTDFTTEFGNDRGRASGRSRVTGGGDISNVKAMRKMRSGYDYDSTERGANELDGYMKSAIQSID